MKLTDEVCSVDPVVLCVGGGFVDDDEIYASLRDDVRPDGVGLARQTAVHLRTVSN